MVGPPGDGQETGGDGMALVIACGVNVQRRIGVRHIVMDFDVMVNMALFNTVDGNGLGQSSSTSSEATSDVALAAEASDR